LPRWLGLYKVIATTPEFGSYRLAELDGARLTGTFAGRRLKLLRLRTRTDEAPEIPQQQQLQPKAIGQERPLSTRVHWPEDGSHPVVEVPRLHSDLANVPLIMDNDDVDMEDDPDSDGTSEASL
jgi:hypothetical protein